MTYTVVPTAIDGQAAPNADYMNTYIGANFAAGVPDIFTAKGDLAVATAADVAVPFPVGTDGRTLTAESSTATGLLWFCSGASLYDTKLIGSTNDNTWIRLDINTDVYDISGEFAIYKFVATYPGYYLVIINAHFGIQGAGGTDFDAGDYTAVSVYKNGAIYAILGMDYAQSDGQVTMYCEGQTVVDLAAGDYLEIYTYIGTTITLDDFVVVTSTAMIHRIGGA